MRPVRLKQRQLQYYFEYHIHRNIRCTSYLQLFCEWKLWALWRSWQLDTPTPGNTDIVLQQLSTKQSEPSFALLDPFYHKVFAFVFLCLTFVSFCNSDFRTFRPAIFTNFRKFLFPEQVYRYIVPVILHLESNVMKVIMQYTFTVTTVSSLSSLKKL